MFQAMILLVTMHHGSELIEDRRGPYQTESLCQARVTEMKQDMRSAMAHFGMISVQGWCDDSDELGA